MEGLTQQQTGVIKQTPTGFQCCYFLNKDFWVKDNPVTNNTALARVQYAGRNKMENYFIITDNKGVTSIITALKTDYVVSILGKDINYLTFSLITPLGSYNNYVRHS